MFIGAKLCVQLILVNRDAKEMLFEVCMCTLWSVDAYVSLRPLS